MQGAINQTSVFTAFKSYRNPCSDVVEKSPDLPPSTRYRLVPSLLVAVDMDAKKVGYDIRV